MIRAVLGYPVGTVHRVVLGFGNGRKQRTNTCAGLVVAAETTSAVNWVHSFAEGIFEDELSLWTDMRFSSKYCVLMIL